MKVRVKQLIFRESGGFSGLRRGCTLEPDALPKTAKSQLETLLEQDDENLFSSTQAASTTLQMPDMQVYILELVLVQNESTHEEEKGMQHRVWRYPASDVPEALSELIGFLQEQAQPLGKAH